MCTDNSLETEVWIKDLPLPASINSEMDRMKKYFLKTKAPWPLKTHFIITYSISFPFWSGVNLYSKCWFKSQLLPKYFSPLFPSLNCILIEYSIIRFSDACLISSHLGSYLLEARDQALFPVVFLKRYYIVVIFEFLVFCFLPNILWWIPPPNPYHPVP